MMGTNGKYYDDNYFHFEYKGLKIQTSTRSAFNLIAEIKYKYIENIYTCYLAFNKNVNVGPISFFLFRRACQKSVWEYQRTIYFSYFIS